MPKNKHSQQANDPYMHPPSSTHYMPTKAERIEAAQLQRKRANQRAARGILELAKKQRKKKKD